MKKYLGVILLCGLALVTQAQVMKSSYSLSSDTTVNTGTSYLGINKTGAKATTAVQVTATKISGTVAGTISLLGSVDGVNYKALTLEDASTALHTWTATDVASQTFIWRLKGNPVPYYRVSWTGSGTMSAKFTAQLYAQ